MIESSVLGTSPWNTDLWKDGSGSFLGFENLLDSGDGLPLSSELSGETGLLDPERSPSLSSSGPLEGDFNFWNELEDFIEKDTSATYGLDLDELSLDPTESSEVLSDWSSCGGGAAFEDSEGHRSRQRLRRGLSPVPSDVPQASSSSAKSWSSMSGEEQLRTVETLTEAISHQLGLREQLDVIRIIDPTACIDPAANREFVVDLRHLDDCKLRQIAEYVQRNADAASEQVGGQAEDAGEAGSTRKKGRRRGSGRRSASEHSSPASASKKVAPKRGRRKRHRQAQTVTWNQRKAHRQMLKEKRSGLFVHEQVLTLKGATAAPAAVSSRPGSSSSACFLEEEDEEEVDILH